jgi:pimeloyl-ACP methyl ester carboxylesterase
MPTMSAQPQPLALARQETGQGPPLVILPGLFGQARNWAAVAKALAPARRVIACDPRNHGDSPWSDRMDYDAMAADLAALIEGLPAGRTEVLGHSMGGKAAMLLALDRPDLVERLIVADIAPVAYDAAGLRPYVRALREIDPTALGNRKAVDRALAEQVPDAGVRAFLLSNLDRRDGGLVWKPNLAAIDAGLEAISGFPARAATYDGPTLVLAGAKSPYVAADGKAEIARLFPSAEVRQIPGAGHWIHAEAPAATIAELKGFLGIA